MNKENNRGSCSKRLSELYPACLDSTEMCTCDHLDGPTQSVPSFFKLSWPQKKYDTLYVIGNVLEKDFFE